MTVLLLPSWDNGPPLAKSEPRPSDRGELMFLAIYKRTMLNVDDMLNSFVIPYHVVLINCKNFTSFGVYCTVLRDTDLNECY